MFESARMTEYPVISLGDLNFDYALNETLSTNPIYYIETAYEMRQLNDQPTRVDDKTSSLLDVILTSHPELHRKSEVLKYTLSDYFLIYTHIEFKDTKSPTADHNTVRFRDMKNFDADIFAHDLMVPKMRVKYHGGNGNRHTRKYVINMPRWRVYGLRNDLIHGSPMI